MNMKYLQHNHDHPPPAEVADPVRLIDDLPNVAEKESQPSVPTFGLFI